MEIVGIVLGAGSSRRLGRAKQTLPLDGDTILGWATKHAGASSLDHVVVVVSGAARHDESLPRGPGRAVVAYNDHYAEGCAKSIVAGLDAAGEPDAILLLLGDVPDLKPRLIDTVVETWKQTGDWAAVSSYRGTLGHPIVFSAEAFDDLRALHGDKAVWKIVDRQLGLKMRPISVDTMPPRDIDTWEDYLAVCKDWKYSPPDEILREAAAFRRQ